MSTWPLTFRVRSKWPAGAADACTTEMATAASTTAIFPIAFSFIQFLPPATIRFLLQDHLLAFFQATEKFGFRAIGNAHGDGNLLLAVFAGWISNLHGR